MPNKNKTFKTKWLTKCSRCNLGRNASCHLLSTRLKFTKSVTLSVRVVLHRDLSESQCRVLGYHTIWTNVRCRQTHCRWQFCLPATKQHCKLMHCACSIVEVLQGESFYFLSPESRPSAQSWNPMITRFREWHSNINMNCESTRSNVKRIKQRLAEVWQSSNMVGSAGALVRWGGITYLLIDTLDITFFFRILYSNLLFVKV